MSSNPREARAGIDSAWAYCLLRLLAGVNLFGHGTIRLIHGDAAFAQGMVRQMAGTPLSPAVVSAFGHGVPFLELVLGLMLLCAIFTRAALITGLIFLALLMFGVTLLQDWPTAASQLIYGVVFSALLAFRADYDRGWFALLAESRRSL